MRFALKTTDDHLLHTVWIVGIEFQVLLAYNIQMTKIHPQYNSLAQPERPVYFPLSFFMGNCCGTIESQIVCLEADIQIFFYTFRGWTNK